MLEKEEQRLRTAREHLLKALNQPSPVKSFTAPIFVVPTLGRTLRKLKWSLLRNGRGLKQADESLEGTLTEIEQQMRYWADKHANYRRQQATAYMLRGAIAAANASRRSIKDSKDLNLAALNFFKQALDIDPNDRQALEYAAHQQRIFEYLDEAQANYEVLLRLTEGPETDDALIRMRAHRYIGEILEKKHEKTGVAQRLSEATTALNSALQHVPVPARDGLEHAYICRTLASVQAKRGQVGWLSTARNAERMFLMLGQRRDHKREAAKAHAELRNFIASRTGSITQPQIAVEPASQPVDIGDAVSQDQVAVPPHPTDKPALH